MREGADCVPQLVPNDRCARIAARQHPVITGACPRRLPLDKDDYALATERVFEGVAMPTVLRFSRRRPLKRRDATGADSWVGHDLGLEPVRVLLRIIAYARQADLDRAHADADAALGQMAIAWGTS